MPLRRLLCLAAWLSGAAAASAQLALTVSLDRERYIAYEPIQMTVKLKNYTGHNLDFRKTDTSAGGYLDLEITDVRREPVRRLRHHFNPVANLVLPTGAEKALTLPLNDVFYLHKQGDYELTVKVGHSRLSHDFLSERHQFQVRAGTTVWEQQVGMPGNDSDGPIATRQCSINAFHDERNDLYFLKIEDENNVYALARLGPRVKSIKPQCDVDARSHVHVLVQIEPRLFRYRVFDLNGQVLVEHIYIIGKGVPRLIRDPDVGRVMVVGGRIAVEGVDYNVESPLTMFGEKGPAPGVASDKPPAPKPGEPGEKPPKKRRWFFF